MPLVRLKDGPSQWHDVREAANVLWRGGLYPDMPSITTDLQTLYSNPNLTACPRETGLNASRRGIVVCNDKVITIAFFGSDQNELHMNWWIYAKGPGWWEAPYPVHENGNLIHSFFRDMWHRMRSTTYDALSRAVEDMAARGTAPERIIITGFSMGGGVSILAFTEILEHIRSKWGSSWAPDDKLGSLVQHLTFAAVPGADQGYYTILNRLYEKHQIRSWDFVNHCDTTIHLHPPQFRSWLGHRYILPDAVVRFCDNAFGEHNHSILGYLKAAEWMAKHGTDQVKSAYSY